MEKKPAYPQTGVASTCRSYEEYERMFGIEPDKLLGEKVLDVAGGASSFTAQLCDRGIDAYAADPFYAGDRQAVIARARREIDTSSAKIAAMKHVYDWSYYGSPARHRQIRDASLEAFAVHFQSEAEGERYVAASLPQLPFGNDTFSLIVCSHFLFLYADQFDQAFHEAALRELLRAAKPGGEIRIYPLVTLAWEPVPYMNRLLDLLAEEAEASLVPCCLPFVPRESSVLALRKKIHV
ncbi:class I SAM-dependent methyltransferase [Cohnella hashimotonis]|uniref:Class I SAM-dependent methyltransferase n=1 Tax=Cohnella hashimotonis TaxID=2826895 RepID=A0ABT6TIU8_9BACL|nr:class I SAM-dependent methyltransferase [Cohnella hashimotonis]MDI4646751.1 class I SAM-dependent methyltransferase [Cohnella hashimotonis]